MTYTKSHVWNTRSFPWEYCLESKIIKNVLFTCSSRSRNDRQLSTVVIIFPARPWLSVLYACVSFQTHGDLAYFSRLVCEGGVIGDCLVSLESAREFFSRKTLMAHTSNHIQRSYWRLMWHLHIANGTYWQYKSLRSGFKYKPPHQFSG